MVRQESFGAMPKDDSVSPAIANGATDGASTPQGSMMHYSQNRSILARVDSKSPTFEAEDKDGYRSDDDSSSVNGDVLVQHVARHSSDIGFGADHKAKKAYAHGIKVYMSDDSS